jgi:lipopolysaccharide export system protein LptA
VIFQKHKFKLALFFGAFFLGGVLFSQNNTLELLPGTEKVIYNKKSGKHRLIGSVSFIYQGNTMYCDSAYYQEKEKIVYAYGNVQIRKQDINVFCDSLYYNGSVKYAKLWGHVRVRDQEYKITSESMEYDAKNSKAIYRNQGQVESIVSNEKITSKVGYFFPKTGSFFFSQKVTYRKNDLSMTTDTLQFSYEKQTAYFFGPTKIINDSIIIYCKRGSYHVNKNEATLYNKAEIIQDKSIIRGNTIYYNKPKQIFNATGNVFIKDLKQNLIFLSDKGFSNDSLHTAYLSGNAIALKVQEKDTMYIFADSIILKKDSLNQLEVIFAHANVQIFQNKLTAISDSAEYRPKIKLLKLKSNPIVWADNSELKGEKMDIILNDSLIEKILISGKTSALMELDSGKFYNQLSGREMITWLKNNELISVDLLGNAWTILYPEQEDKLDSLISKKRMGLNRIFASKLKIYLDSGEVIGITYYDKPDGIFFPMDKIKLEEQFIKNFDWKAALRPKNSFVFSN